MIALKSIIDTFNPEDQQKFIGYLEEKNKRKDTKNIRLFKLIAKGEEDSKVICYQLYKTNKTNAYHALRKRLLQSLIDFTANKSIEDENSVEIQIIKYILASRVFLLRKTYDVAFKILDKAERLADEHLLFPMLNEIYHTKIQYANHYPKSNLEALITKQKENQKKHQLEDQLNIVYAKLKSVLNAINSEGKVIHLESELSKILNDYNIELNESLSFKSLYQVLAIANISALITTKYFEIEAFVVKTYNLLKHKKESNKQLYYQIHIAYIIANTFFRNKKFKNSLQFIDEMHQLMQLKRSTYYNDFTLKKTLLEALNYNYTNRQDKAILLLETVLEKKQNDIEGLLDLQLALFMFYFQQEEFSKAKSIIAEFYHTDQWYSEKSTLDWVIKKNVAELLLYIELQDDNLFYSRLKSFQRRYKHYLKQIGQERILTFLSIAEQYHKKPESITTNEFKNKVSKSFEWTTVKEEDIFVMSFYAWLKNKIEKGDLYRTTLQLIEI
jgi:hypothetical protein